MPGIFGETLGNFTDAFIVSSKLSRTENESTHEWVSRVLTTVSLKFKNEEEKHDADIVNPAWYMKAMPYVIYMWYTMAKVSEEKGAYVDAQKYWAIHGRCKEVNVKMRSPIRLAFIPDQFSIVWTFYEEAARIMKQYLAGNGFGDYDEALLKSSWSTL